MCSRTRAHVVDAVHQPILVRPDELVVQLWPDERGGVEHQRVDAPQVGALRAGPLDPSLDQSLGDPDPSASE
jgi:hypothetical protein